MRRIAALVLVIAAAGAAAVFPADTALSLTAEGAAAAAAMNYHRAVERYKAALSLNPSYFVPMTGLAECFFYLEEYDEAERWAARARSFQADDMDLRVLDGRIRIGLGDVAGARKLFSEVLARQPNHLEARFGIAEAEVAAGRARNAISLYAEAFRMAPESVKAVLSLAVLCDETGDAAAADRYFDMALRAHSGDPRVQLSAGSHFLRVGDFPAAEKRARIALSLKGDLEPARMLLGSVLLQTGRAGDAVETFRQVIAANRDNALAWYGLGLAYSAAGDPAKAMSSLSTGLSVRAEDELARVAGESIAMDFLKMDDPQRRKMGSYHLDLGGQMEARNFQEKALAEYRRTLLLDPTSRDGRVAYARIFRFMGYPARYLNELKVLSRLGVKDTFVSDEVEALTSQLAGSLSDLWGVDQFAVERRKYTVPVFTIPSANRLLHPQSDTLAVRYFTDMLTRIETVVVPSGPQTAASFEDAFRRAREQGTDYFMVLGVDETDRTFSASAGMYLSRTGSRLAFLSAFRTGNDRMRDTYLRIVSQAAPLFPPRGTLLVRKFDDGVVDLGVFHGLKAGTVLAVVRKGKVRLDAVQPGLSYDDADVLGRLTVTAVDETIAAGRLERAGAFDFINPGDEVVFPVARAAPAAPPPPAGGGNLITRLLGIRR
jgi:tetratricopeptide (TPR) repeat protein